MIFWGLLAGIAFLGLFGLLVFVLVFAAVMHSWGLFWAELGNGAVLVLALAAGRRQ